MSRPGRQALRKNNRTGGGLLRGTCAKRVDIGNWRVFACAGMCSLPSAEVCLAAGEPLPFETAFAYAISHPVAPLPEVVIGRWAIIDGGEFGRAETLEGPIIVPVPAPRPMSRANVCSAVASVARANDLPVPFFANLIWQESNFNPGVVSPSGAQGIAQFMPATAKQYGLTNPFDPIHALNAAGRFLNKLVAQFGNLGLAAAAYNAGPGRVSEFVSRRRQLPGETKDYVVRITGRPAEKWTSSVFVRTPAAKLMPAKAPCAEVAQAFAAEVKVLQMAKLVAPNAHQIRARLTVKGKTALVAFRKPAQTALKIADRIAPEKTMAAKQTKDLVGRIARIAKANIVPKSAPKSAGGRVPAKRTRIAAAS